MSPSAPAPAVKKSDFLSLAADYYNRYPGELVTLFLRLRVPEKRGAVLQLEMPRVMQAETYALPEGVPTTLPSVVEHGQDVLVLIPLDKHFKPGAMVEMQVGVRIQTFYANQRLFIEARLVDNDANTIDEETLRLTIFGKGKYLDYLPEIYQSDDFTSRFLMFFESFWKPIGQQIDQVENYFDPDLTPPGFLPWLASWMGVPVEDKLPIERTRALLRNSLALFQRRGTRHALQTYLEIYTSGKASIVERRAANFVLGASATLGNEIALGRENQPNTVLIRLRVPKAELERTQFTPEVYRRKMIQIVRGIIPAHVTYDVECTFDA